MEHEFNTLMILAEVTTAFVAFSAIVASLNLTLGKKLTPHQKLLVHFFTESGMFTVSTCLLPLVLWAFWQDEVVVARYTMIYVVVGAGTYLAWYLRQRMKIDAPTPLITVLTGIGYGVVLCVYAGALTGILWQPSLAMIAAGCLWGLCSGALIFSYFLSSFVDSEEASA